jgi:hypothetical protein
MSAPYAPSQAIVVQYTCSVLFEKKVTTQLFIALFRVLYYCADSLVYVYCKLAGVMV